MKKFYYLVNSEDYPVERPSEDWFVNGEPTAEAISFIVYAEYEGRKFETIKECLANCRNKDYALVTDVIIN